VQKVFLTCLLAVLAALLAIPAVREAPTIDETAHLPAGISHWEHARFALYRVNPPLVRMVSATLPLLMQPKTEWKFFWDSPDARSDFMVANDFMAANEGDFLRYYRAARLACIPFSLLGGYVCYRWAKEVYAQGSGVREQ
jgi:hypothetical protein